ncbi:MAG: hypothetical protein IT305_14530 [Chloroflexi bacterium]|nr:hypothetical protein [Chloroflexota bacterium]
MRGLPLRLTRPFVNLILGEPGAVLTEEAERELALTRWKDPYFLAFRARCLAWIYGRDPRRDLS